MDTVYLCDGTYDHEHHPDCMQPPPAEVADATAAINALLLSNQSRYARWYVKRVARRMRKFGYL